VILGFRREVDELCALLGCYITYGSPLTKTLENGIDGAYTSVSDCRHTVRYIQEERKYQWMTLLLKDVSVVLV
jgi:hypothetical protein